MIRAEEIISYIQILILFAIALQTIEYLQIRHAFSKIWDWEILKNEFHFFPFPFYLLVHYSLKLPNFIFFLYFRIFITFFLFLDIAIPSLEFPDEVQLLGFIFLGLSSILIALRWRGVFNGGSDYMTLIVVFCVILSKIPYRSEVLVHGALWLIAIQTCSSYFISGLVKLKRKSWRTGVALSGFLTSSIYSPPKVIVRALQKPNQFLSKALSWSIILFELGFPFSLLHPKVCIAFISLAVAFHLVNVWVFGLNRFLFSWGATYPALYYCSTIAMKTI